MNMAEVNKKILERESLFPSFHHFNGMMEKLPIFAPAIASDDIPAKQYESIRNQFVSSKAYEYQMQTLGHIKDIRVTHAIGQCEMVVPILVERYAALKKSIKLMETAFEKVKQSKPCYDVCVSIKTAVKADFGLMLKQDIEKFIELHSIEVDIASAMTAFKAAS